MATETFSYTQLIVGNGPAATSLRTLLSGNTAAIGKALRRYLTGVIAAVEGNTGDGVPGALTVGAKAKVGVYTLTCIAAVANKGTFAVVAPDGTRLADLTATVAYDNGHFGVTIADDTDFVVGDAFTVTISDSGKVVPYDDPDAIFAGIAAEAIDATSADAYGTAWMTGEFRAAAVTFATGVTLTDAIRVALERVGVYLKPTIG